MSANFEECWNEFRRRTFPRYAVFIQLFKEKYSSAFENATSILDIGAGITVISLKMRQRLFKFEFAICLKYTSILELNNLIKEKGK